MQENWLEKVIDISAFLNVLNNIWPYLVAVLLFLVLILIHEFGHFIAAKALGVRVNEFAIGFGPKLFSKQGKVTKYSFNLIPLGGYCAMEGEDESSDDSAAFCNKSAWRRFLIVIMGAVFNLLLGLIIVGITLIPSKMFATTVVAELPQKVISQNNLLVGDEILEVDGRKIFTSYDLSYSFTNVKDGKIDLLVERDGEKLELQDVAFDTQKDNGITYLDMKDFALYGKKKTVGSYITQTVKTSFSFCAVTWRSLVDMLKGEYGLSAVSGPVGVTVTVANVAKQNLFNVLPIMALITINLGIFNLLPIPALDGGRLLFILFEMIFRKPVPQKYESVIHTVGFVILFGFMILVAAKDIWSLIF